MHCACLLCKNRFDEIWRSPPEVWRVPLNAPKQECILKIRIITTWLIFNKKQICCCESTFIITFREPVPAGRFSVYSVESWPCSQCLKISFSRWLCMSPDDSAKKTTALLFPWNLEWLRLLSNTSGLLWTATILPPCGMIRVYWLQRVSFSLLQWKHKWQWTRTILHMIWFLLTFYARSTLLHECLNHTDTVYEKNCI